MKGGFVSFAVLESKYALGQTLWRIILGTIHQLGNAVAVHLIGGVWPEKEFNRIYFNWPIINPVT